MSSWLKQILKEDEEVNETELVFCAKADEMNTETDRVVGIAGPELRKLYAVFLSRANKMRAIIEAKPCVDGVCRCSERDAELKPLQAELDAIRDIFWQSVRHDFPELAQYDLENLRVRKNWELAWIDENDLAEPGLPEDVQSALVAALFGGPIVGRKPSGDSDN